jgi:sarcosine oxidase, subunit beta
MRQADMADVVIVGAGISGAAAAYELATAGLSVILIDRYGPAAMASGWTLAGVRQSGRHPAELPLARQAVALWQDLAERLDAPTHYRQGGNLRLARTPDECAVIARLVQEQSTAGLDLSLIDAQQVAQIAPAVSPTVLAGSYCATDGHADPQATVQAFVDAAVRAGAQTRFGETVRSIDVASGRVTGVSTDKGRIAAGRVVLAAGVFGNRLLEPLGLSVPLQIRVVTVIRTAPVAPVLEQVIGVANADCAGRQEVTGRFRFTSDGGDWTGEMEDGARPRVRPAARSAANAITRFGGVVPAALDAPIDEIWAGLIDRTPDALPVLQSVTDPAGLVIAMGFSGHGFCLGPVTGRIAAAMVQDQPVDLPIEPFALARFDRWNAPTNASAAGLHG